MPGTPENKPRNLYACLIVRRFLANIHAVDEQLTGPWNSVLSENDLVFLTDFLTSTSLTSLLKLIDFSTTSGNESTKSSFFQPLISNLRPKNQEDRNFLLNLTDVWNDLEALITKDTESKNVDARELYKLLGDDNIRELLLAADDVANLRYAAYVDEFSVFLPLVMEPEPLTNSTSPSRLFSTDLYPFDRAQNQPLPKSLSVTSHQRMAGVYESEQNRSYYRSPDGISQPSQTNINDGISFAPLNLKQSQDSFEDDKSSQFAGVTNGEQSPNFFKNIQERTAKTVPLSSIPNPILPDSPTDRRFHAFNPSPPTPSLRRSSRTSIAPSNNADLPNPGEIRTVRIRREFPGEPLGVTLGCRTPSPLPASENSSHSKKKSANSKHRKDSSSTICIKRIIVGSLADRNGQLYPGDVLLELNGTQISSLETAHQTMLASGTNPEFHLLVRSPLLEPLKTHTLSRSHRQHKVFIRCLFSYDPTKDPLLPAGHIGLAFRSGEVLELVDSQDLNWWQVRRLNTSGNASLIPSQMLEEKRQAFNQQKSTFELQKKPRKIKTIFRASDSSNLLVRSDLWIYEEVVPWPPAAVHTLLLIGPNGVGRRTLKFLLSTKCTQRFAFPLSDTTDPTASTALFHIRSRKQMETDIRQGAFVEWGSIDNHYYGVRFSALREIIFSGRTVVLDCQVQSVHLLHQPEFNPHVVFIASPVFETAREMMDRGIREKLTLNKRTDAELLSIVAESEKFAIRNQHLYTHTLVNSDMLEGVDKLSRLVARLEKQPGWIPAGWAYEMNLPKSAVGPMGEFVPGSSTLSGLGIQALPPSSHSMIGRLMRPGSVSAESPESAARLARPPSICSSLILNPMNSSGRRLYEKRGQRARDFQPTGSPIAERSGSAHTNLIKPESVSLLKTQNDPIKSVPRQEDPRLKFLHRPIRETVSGPRGMLNNVPKTGVDASKLYPNGEISSTSSESEP